MQELEGLAEYRSVKPPAAARAGAQCNVEGDAHQAGTDSRARHVLHKAVGDGFKDIGAAGAPQHCGISCGGKEILINIKYNVCLISAYLKERALSFQHHNNYFIYIFNI